MGHDVFCIAASSFTILFEMGRASEPKNRLLIEVAVQKQPFPFKLHTAAQHSTSSQAPLGLFPGVLHAFIAFIANQPQLVVSGPDVEKSFRRFKSVMPLYSLARGKQTPALLLLPLI
jgi:hypothetical protein